MVMDEDQRARWAATRAESARLIEEADRRSIARTVWRAEHAQLVEEAPPAVPDWRRFTSVSAMSSREYSLWVDCGKPALGDVKAAPPPPPPPQPRQPDERAVVKGISRGVAGALADELALLRGANEALRERLEKLEGALAAERSARQALEKRLTTAEARQATERSIPKRRQPTGPRKQNGSAAHTAGH